MKKLLLTIASIGCLGMPVFSQYYYIPTQNGTNPKGVNTEGENPASLLTGWTSRWSGNATSAATLTPAIALPFAFTFNGNAVTHIKASNSGSVTFDTTTTTAPAFGNSTLPAAGVPNNSINVLGIKPSSWTSGTTTYTSTIITKTLGTAPRRQFWIQYNFFSEPNIQTGWTYWAIVLEEGSNRIFIVDMKTLCTSASGICNNNVKISAGIQVNASTAYTVNGSPNLGAFNFSTNVFDASDNQYYEFIAGTQPAKDVANATINVSKSIGLNQAPIAISGKARNIGSAAINSYKITYQINNDAPIVSSAITATVASAAYFDYVHPTNWTPPSAGNYTLKTWISEINGGADESNINDTLTKTITVLDAMVPRRSLHEIFTSSTCPPCKPGNEVMHKVLNQRVGTYAVIKYQYFGPGTGDPYFTTECYNRGVYYGQTASGTPGYGVPELFIDGQWGNNPNGYSTAIFDQYQEKPAFVEITPTMTLSGKTVNVSATIKPIIDFPAGSYKVRMAIVEKTAFQNVKTNGETEFNYVMKKMLPDDNGKDITLPAKNNTTTVSESYTFNGDFKLPVAARTSSSVVPTGAGYSGVNLSTNHSVENFEDLAVVVFIQNNTTKEVLQSAWTAQDFPVGIADEKNNAINTLIYPNPAQNQITIGMGALNQAEVTIIDISGKTIITKQITADQNTISTDTLNNGLYFVQVKAEGKTSIHKLVIQK